LSAEAQRHLLRLLDLAREGPPPVGDREHWVRDSLSRYGATLEALRESELKMATRSSGPMT